MKCVLSLPAPCRVWASGIGYGHDHGGEADDIWNASAAEAAQAAHDAELQKLLEELTAGLRQQLQRSTGERVLVFMQWLICLTACLRQQLGQSSVKHALASFSRCLCTHTVMAVFCYDLTVEVHMPAGHLVSAKCHLCCCCRAPAG